MFTAPNGETYECDGSVFCCTLLGTRCEYSVEDQAGRRYACGLMVKYGSWEAMQASPEYAPIGQMWEDHHNPDIGWNYCQQFDPAFCCRPEFKQGRANQYQTVVIG